MQHVKGGDSPSTTIHSTHGRRSWSVTVESKSFLRVERRKRASTAFIPYPALMRFTRSLAAFATTLAAASTALAQESMPPPEPIGQPTPGPVVGYIVMAILFGIIVTVSLMPSKRSHTDL